MFKGYRRVIQNSSTSQKYEIVRKWSFQIIPFYDIMGFSTFLLNISNTIHFVDKLEIVNVWYFLIKSPFVILPCYSSVCRYTQNKYISKFSLDSKALLVDLGLCMFYSIIHLHRPLCWLKLLSIQLNQHFGRLFHQTNEFARLFAHKHYAHDDGFYSCKTFLEKNEGMRLWIIKWTFKKSAVSFLYHTSIQHIYNIKCELKPELTCM